MSYIKFGFLIAAVALVSAPSMAEAQSFTQRGTRGGAIAGAIAGAGCGEESLPVHWRNQLAEWPRGINWMQDLSTRLANQENIRTSTQPAPSLRWGRTMVRNLVFGMVVIVLFLRRYIPVSTQNWR